ncbi:MAG: Gfo/Idh/MocA family oxidoreductase [Actinomycetota bacterium]
MTSIGIIGGGKGATLHADAVIHTRGAELVGVGGRPGSAEELAAVADAPDRSLPDLCADADAVIVAVPPPEVGGVLEAIGAEVERGARVKAVLVEPPLRDIPVLSIPVVLGANLLHARVVRQALREIAAMHEPHHLQMRIRQPRPDWGAHGTPAFGGPLHDPGLRLAPVLLSAAAEPAVHVEVADIANGVHAAIELESGRRAGLDVAWTDGSSRIELEAADAAGVILLQLDPLPHLEIDGRTIEPPELHPLEALGFVPQIDRLGRTAAGAAPWPDVSVGTAIEALFPGV